MKKYRPTILSLFLLLTLLFNSFAFDGNREGFVLGIGLGFSNLSYDLKQKTTSLSSDLIGYSGNESRESRENSSYNFASNFLIGYAVNNNWIIQWSSKVSWFGLEQSSNLNSSRYRLPRPQGSSEPKTYMSAIAGIGVSYYFNEKSPSPFLSSVILGFSNIANFEEGKNNFGLGLSWGAGYEFASHWNLQLDFCYGLARMDDSDYGIKNVLTFMLTLNALAY